MARNDTSATDDSQESKAADRHPDETSSKSEDATIDRVMHVGLDEPCPNCDTMFGQSESDRVRKRNPLPEAIEGEATIRRIDGNLTFEVEFSCPECSQDFLVEDLSDGTMTTQ